MSITTPTYLTRNLAELWLVTPGFDDLRLTGENVDDGGHRFLIDSLAEEATWDNPVPIDVAVQRWMADGAVASSQGHDNRTPYFKVKVSAANAADLAAGEAALAKRATRPGQLVWYPASGANEAPATVFEVWTWHLEHVFDSDRETRLGRMYGVRCTAKPWVRSLNPTTVVALATVVTPTTTTVDTCSALTGWTGSPNTPTLGSGVIIESSTVTGFTGRPSAISCSLTRTGVVTGLATKPFLGIDATVNASGTITKVTIDSQTLTQAGSSGSVTWWNIPVGVVSFTTLTITGTRTVPGAGTYTVTLKVNTVQVSDALGGIGSHKQLYRSIDVGGSVPTSGSIHVSAASGMGVLLLYTCPNTGTGYTPALRQFRVSGNTVTPDATAVSGAYELMVTGGGPPGTPGAVIQYLVPSAQLREGSYAVLARIKTVDSAATVTAQVLVENGDVISSVTGTGVLTASNLWWVVLGVVALPPQPLPVESIRNINIAISATSPTGLDVSLDEAYLFDITHGALTLMHTKAATTHVWIDAPDVDPVRNRPAVYSGTISDRTDAAAVASDTPSTINGWLLALGDHDLAPDGAVLFTVTDAVDDAAVSASFYHRWHTHAGD